MKDGIRRLVERQVREDPHCPEDVSERVTVHLILVPLLLLPGAFILISIVHMVLYPYLLRKLQRSILLKADEIFEAINQ